MTLHCFILYKNSGRALYETKRTWNVAILSYLYIYAIDFPIPSYDGTLHLNFCWLLFISTSKLFYFFLYYLFTFYIPFGNKILKFKLTSMQKLVFFSINVDSMKLFLKGCKQIHVFLLPFFLHGFHLTNKK